MNNKILIVQGPFRAGQAPSSGFRDDQTSMIFNGPDGEHYVVTVVKFPSTLVVKEVPTL